MGQGNLSHFSAEITRKQGDILSHKLKKLHKKEEGQAVIEFAFILPFFLLLIFAIIEFGWTFYNYIGVENSARNAARIACVEYLEDTRIPNSGTKILTYDAYINDEYKVYDEEHKLVPNSDGDIFESAFETVKDIAPPSTYSSIVVLVTYSYDQECIDNTNLIWDASNRGQGNVEVSVSCDVKLLTGMFNRLLGAHKGDEGHLDGTKTLTSKSTFKVEKQHDLN